MSQVTTIESPDAKRCANCQERKPRAAFALDRSRADGLTYWCRDCRNARARARHTAAPPRPLGGRLVAPRDGDVRQARRRVNYLVDAGLLPDPDDVACVDCGHRGEGPRHEYDHHMGYAAEHHETVESVCSACHHAREAARKAAA